MDWLLCETDRERDEYEQMMVRREEERRSNREAMERERRRLTTFAPSARGEAAGSPSVTRRSAAPS